MGFVYCPVYQPENFLQCMLLYIVDGFFNIFLKSYYEEIFHQDQSDSLDTGYIRHILGIND